MVWRDGPPDVKPLGFGLSTLELRAVLTVGASEKTVDAAAAVAAEGLEEQLEEQGIQRVEVVGVTAGDGAGHGALFDDLYHFGLLEPHVRTHAPLQQSPHSTAVGTALC